MWYEEFGFTVRDGQWFSAYDIIAIGTPTWWHTMAPAVRSFLAQHDFAGKTAVPFMTNGGSRIETKQSEVDRWIDAVKALAA